MHKLICTAVKNASTDTSRGLLVSNHSYRVNVESLNELRYAGDHYHRVQCWNLKMCFRSLTEYANSDLNAVISLLSVLLWNMVFQSVFLGLQPPIWASLIKFASQLCKILALSHSKNSCSWSPTRTCTRAYFRLLIHLVTTATFLLDKLRDIHKTPDIITLKISKASEWLWQLVIVDVTSNI